MTDTPVARRRLKRATVRKLALFSSSALAVLGIAAAAYFFMSGHLASRAEQENQALKLQVESLAERIAGVIGGAALKLSVIGDRAEVADALIRRDTAALKSLSGAAGSGVKNLLAVRLLTEDTRTPDESTNPPMGFASLDMIARASAGDGNVPAEMHMVGTDQAHIVVLQPIHASDGRLLGFVHGSFSPELVQAPIAELAGGGWVSLTQPVPRAAPQRIAGAGGVEPPADESQVSAAVPGTAWTVHYAGSPGTAAMSEAGRQAEGSGSKLLVWLGGGALLVLLFAGALVFWLRHRADMAGETVILQGAVRAIMDGAHPGLERLVPGLAGMSPAAAPANAALNDRLEGDDITTFTPSGAAAEDAAAAEAADRAEIDAIFAVDGGGIEVSEGDEPDTMDSKSSPAEAPDPTLADTPVPDTGEGRVPSVIFRAYDIRGIVGETLTTDTVRLIGLALGSEAFERGQQGIVVARDGRLSSPEFAEALIGGLLDSGRDVIDIGCVPTPVLYFATHYLDTGSGVMITGSHNPGNYNGFKIVLDGQTLSGEAISAIRARIEAEDFTSGSGNLQNAEMISEYVRRISEDVPVALGNALKVVVDCGNGVPGVVAPQLLRALGHDVVELYCEVDGNFPNHHPDPSQPENLQDLIDLVSLENADLGLAFDGDGDRLGVVDAAGNVIWPDRQMILFARDVLARNPGGEIIFDVKCSGRLRTAIEEAGGKATMWNTGHSLIKAKMQESGALLAGEMSGHIFFKERWYGFDDAMYSAARLVEIICNADVPAVELFAALPDGVATPELKIELPESEHKPVMAALLEAADFPDATITTIDGLRVDFEDCWGLIRPSNTTPCLVLRFEGDDADALARVQARFRELIGGVAPGLSLPF